MLQTAGSCNMRVVSSCLTVFNAGFMVWTTEGEESAGNNPVKIAVLHFLIVLVLIQIKHLKVKEPVHHRLSMTRGTIHRQYTNHQRTPTHITSIISRSPTHSIMQLSSHCLIISHRTTVPQANVSNNGGHWHQPGTEKGIPIRPFHGSDSHMCIISRE